MTNLEKISILSNIVTTTAHANINLNHDGKIDMVNTTVENVHTFCETNDLYIYHAYNGFSGTDFELDLNEETRVKIYRGDYLVCTILEDEAMKVVSKMVQDKIEFTYNVGEILVSPESKTSEYISNLVFNEVIEG